MKNSLLIFIIVALFSSCIQNYGTGLPPITKLNFSYYQYDSIAENENYELDVEIIEENDAIFDELIVNYDSVYLIYNQNDIRGNKYIHVEFTNNYSIEEDSTIYISFSVSSKNSDIIYKNNLYLTITNN